MPDERARLEAKLTRLRELVHIETRRHLIQLAEYAAESARVEADLDALRRADALQPHRAPRTVNTMRTVSDNLLPPAPRRKRAPNAPRKPPAGPRPWTHGKITTSSHRFPQALLARGMTVEAWATAHGTKRERVKGWYAPYMVDGVKNRAHRKITRKWADLIAAEFPECPADATTWPGGILEGTDE